MRALSACGSRWRPASGALLTVRADGSYDYDPNGAFDAVAAGGTGADSFTYAVSDAVVTDEATVTIDIADVNDAPILTDDTVATDQSMPLSFDPLGNDTDPDAGDVLTLAAIDGVAVALDDTVAVAAGGSLTVTAGGLTFDQLDAYDSLGAGQETVVAVTYAVTDLSGAVADVAISITVTGINDAPEFTSPTGFSMAEGGVAVGTVAATDVDLSDTLVFALDATGDGALFDIDITTGALTFRAAPHFETPNDPGSDHVYDLTVSLTDGTATVQQAIAVTVTDAIEGGAMGEVLTGGTKDDTIRSGGGPLDLAYRGVGADTFVFENIVGARDVFRIRDLTFGDDHLDLNGETVVLVRQSARSTLVLLDGAEHDVIIIDGVGIGHDLFA
jgi:VCBS repeat-containing protein